MLETRVFNESVLTTYANLQNFFHRSPSIQHVLSKKNTPYSDTPIPIQPRLACQWQVCQIATAPFRGILAIFFEAIATGLDCCNCSQAAKDMKNWSVHMIVGFNTFSNETTKVMKIASCINGPNNHGKVINDHPSIPGNRVDENVKKYTFCDIHNEIRFNHHKGICRGMSDWFLYLYLHTKDQFSNPRAHMAALGEQFTNGGGIDPTLLQSLYLNTGNLLNLKIGAQSDADDFCTALIKQTPDQWRTNSSTIISQLKALPIGAYVLGLPKHRTAFVKVNEELGYFFDPNRGIIEIQGPELAEKLHDIVSVTLKRIGDGSEHRALQLYVYFEPCTLRTTRN